MVELRQITNAPDFARRCDPLDGLRPFVDLERQGKAERQAGRNTFISAHRLDDIAAGAVVTADMLLCRRPATGIAPRDLPRVAGLRLGEALPAGPVLQWGHFESRSVR